MRLSINLWIPFIFAVRFSFHNSNWKKICSTLYLLWTFPLVRLTSKLRRICHLEIFALFDNNHSTFILQFFSIKTTNAINNPSEPTNKFMNRNYKHSCYSILIGELWSEEIPKIMTSKKEEIKNQTKWALKST